MIVVFDNNQGDMQDFAVPVVREPLPSLSDLQELDGLISLHEPIENDSLRNDLVEHLWNLKNARRG